MNEKINSLESLSEIELKEFIAVRISGLISDAARDTRTRYKPETLLIRAYQTTLDEEFKARFRRVVSQLLCDEWYEIFSNGKGGIKGEYLSRLLYLVELFRIKEAQAAVSSMAFNFKKFVGVKGYYTPNLAVQVLAALAPLQDKDSFYADFWKSILEDKKWRRYGGAAFTGLRFYGFQESLHGLPLYIKAGMEYPEDITIDIGVMRFVKQYRDRAVLSAIADRFAKEPEDVRKRLLDALKDIPSIAEEVVKIEPRLTQNQVETVLEKPIKNELCQQLKGIVKSREKIQGLKLNQTLRLYKNRVEMEIQALIFDLDDTLVIRKPDAVHQARIEAYRYLAKRIEEVDEQPPNQQLFEDAWLIVGNQTRAFAQLSLRESQLYERMQQTLNLIGMEKDWKLTWEVSEALSAVMIKATELIEPELPNILEHLKENFALGVISNNQHGPMVTDVLRHHNLERFFQIVVASADIGWRKPHPLIFRYAANFLRLPPACIAYVGDSLESDIEGARNAGMTPILFDRDGRYPNYTAGRKIESLQELRNFRF